ncbi:hypothetical protein ACRAD_26300 [Acinetobacter radioresistens DSM 6976 = NBRC 102413 = CIP 103788]|nr:hypothetical protein ACRAD_26300 [Acinetobacter radioresistens DSM 6976 = NBRC 102413 = CIP 103788]
MWRDLIKRKYKFIKAYIKKCNINSIPVNSISIGFLSINLLKTIILKFYLKNISKAYAYSIFTK